MAQATLVLLILHYKSQTLQNNFHMLSFPYFEAGSLLGQRHKPH